MNPVPASVNAPAQAQVNLLPPEIEAKRTQGRAKAMIYVGLALFVVLLGVAWFLAFSARQSAESQLADEEAKRPQLVAELASYDYIKSIELQKDNSLLARQWAGASDIIWGDYTAALLNVVPDDVTLTDIVMSQGTPFGPAGSDGTVYGLNDMGSLAFTGRAASPELAADMIEAVNSVPGFYDTFVEVNKIAASDEGDTVYWEYSGATRISFEALSDRTVTTQTEAPVRAEVPADSEAGDDTAATEDPDQEAN
jgi:Tfp pilus assembly protein PilN